MPGGSALSAGLGAAQWREFWRSRGMDELRALLRAEWPALVAAPDAAHDACTFRVASLLASRASRTAVADELRRIRGDELGLPPEPQEDARAAETIAAWFARARE